TPNVTPGQVPAEATDTSVSGVEAYGLTSPAPPMTWTVQLLPVSLEHCAATLAPLGRSLGAGPTFSERVATGTSGWLVRRTVTASSLPGTATSAARMVRLDPLCSTVNWSPA